MHICAESVTCVAEVAVGAWNNPHLVYSGADLIAWEELL